MHTHSLVRVVRRARFLQDMLNKSVLEEDSDSIELSDDEAQSAEARARSGRRMSLAAKQGAARQQQQQGAAESAPPAGSKLARRASLYGINTSRLGDSDDDAKVGSGQFMKDRAAGD